MPLYYAYGLLLLFYILLVLEFMIPTGGLVGIAAVVTIISALAVAFAHSVTAGITLLIIVALTTPLIFIAVIRVWPHTPIGRRILNRRPGEMNEGRAKRKLANGTSLDEMVGHIGIAKTNLLPSGLVKVDDVRLDAVSLGMPIDAGQSIIVTKVEAGKVYVRPISEAERAAAERAVATSAESTEPPVSPPSLENPPESFDFDTLDLDSSPN
ncbi:Nodulation efficiency, NfeD [Rhodopirellula maiorica SM1]|uniref:Nodulation efficiency, NfeD n=1 Tax=Rhodopirellula maiorica SM1 TaxID=1265738 RepID=M5RB43_9BACT|nr:NfeD family protein [Rhodopirellula maiorica]EMI16271.1 Nodulation efficiency, NfeD [Rhodopirellula maiorica SM1]